MNKKGWALVFLFLLCIPVVTADLYPLILRAKINNVTVANTTWLYNLTFSGVADCNSSVHYSNRTVAKLDPTGVGSTVLNISSLRAVPNYLCEIRNDTFRASHPVPDLVGASLFGHRLLIDTLANFTGELRYNDSVVCTASNGLCNSTGGSFVQSMVGWNDTGNQVVLLNLSNNVAIGTGVTTAKLSVAGNMTVSVLEPATATFMCRNSDNALATCLSSLQYKTNVTNLTDNQVLDLQNQIISIPVTSFLTKDNPNITHYGLIAEYVTSRINYTDVESGSKTIDFLSAMLGYTWAGIKALDLRLRNLTLDARNLTNVRVLENTTKVYCGNITGGSDSDYCADANSGGAAAVQTTPYWLSQTYGFCKPLGTTATTFTCTAMVAITPLGTASAGLQNDWYFVSYQTATGNFSTAGFTQAFTQTQSRYRPKISVKVKTPNETTLKSHLGISPIRRKY